MATLLVRARLARLSLACISCTAPIAASGDASDSYEKCLKAPRNVVVRIDTKIGNIDVELYGSRAPITVCNFIRYVKAGSFDGGTFFRTVRPDNQTNEPVKIDVIQGDIRKGAKAFRPIPMERTATTGIHHIDGAISMARDGPETATSEFFVSVGDQLELDFGGMRNPDGQGFAAFGRVVRGMDVVRRIWIQPAQGENLTPPIGIKRAIVLNTSVDRR
jgi:peptidyl-prolyl cis-trans isomerase A (cyclophilin A)